VEVNDFDRQRRRPHGRAFLPLRMLAELVNIGTLLAFLIVCVAVLIMRKTDPQMHRPFRCPMVPLVPVLGIAFCLLLMFSLPVDNWLRLIVWLLLGFVVYFAYGRYHSALARMQTMSGAADSRSL
jgi:basic amino acid/polyamine antiporter, APA family